MRQQKGYNRNVLRSLVLITQFGINMLVPICIMSALGIYLDRKFGKSYFMILLFCVGVIAGAQNIYRLAKRTYTNSKNGPVSKIKGEEGELNDNEKRNIKK